MRKADREIKDFDKILALIENADVVRVAFSSEKYPYIVPLSFGYEVVDGKLTFYFHGAKEGYKLDLLKRNNNVCVEGDLFRGYRPTGHSVTADYKSFIAFGKMEIVDDLEEKVKGLQLLLDHCKTPDYSARECALRDITAVLKVSVDYITAKQRFED